MDEKVKTEKSITVQPTRLTKLETICKEEWQKIL